MLRADYAAIATMTVTAEIVEIGDGLGIVLPAELLASLG
jgi:hypothetical protein